MKLFRKLASVFLSLTMLAAMPQVKAEETPEPIDETEEIVLSEDASEEEVITEITQEETEEEEPSEPVLEEEEKQEEENEAPSEEAVTEEIQEEEPAGEALGEEEEEEGSIALDNEIVVPAEIHLPVAGEAPIPVAVNIPGVSAEDLIGDTDNPYVASIYRSDGEFMISAAEAGETTVHLSYWEGDDEQAEIAHADIAVTVEEWFESPRFIAFEEAGETQDITVKAINAAAGSEFVLVPPMEDRDNPVAEATKGEGDVWQIKALRPGRSVFFIKVKDPNPDVRDDWEHVILATQVLVCAEEDTPREIFTNQPDQVNLRNGGTETVIISFDPDNANPNLIEYGVIPDAGEEPVVTIERDPDYPYVYYVHADETRTGHSIVSFHYGDTPTTNVDFIVGEAYATIPECLDDIPVDAQEGVLIPLDTNISEIRRGDANWTISPEDAPLDVYYRNGDWYIEGYNDMEDPATVTLSVTPEGGEEISRSMTVTAKRWINMDGGFDHLYFSGADAEAQMITIPFDGPEECAEFTVVPPAEDREKPVAEATYTETTEEGRVFRVSPKREGPSVLFAEVKNPYDEGKYFHIYVAAVTVYSANAKIKKIDLEDTEFEMEPWDYRELWFSLDPELADPNKVSAKSSNPSLVKVQRSEYNPNCFELITENDKEGKATITLTAGSVKATCTVNVIRSINTDKTYLPLLLEENSTGTITVTLKGRGSGNDVYVRYLRSNSEEDPDTGEDPNPEISPEEAPFTVTKVKQEGDVWTYSVTPKEIGEAEVVFGYENKSDQSETFVHVEVQEMEQIRWRDGLVVDLEDRVWQNNEEVYIQTENVNSPEIRYHIEYYKTEDGARADTSDPDTPYQHHFNIQSKYLGESYAKLRAVAEKPGYRPSVLLDAVLKIDNGDMGVWGEHAAYIEAQEDGLYAVHNKLFVYGIPDAESEDDDERAMVTYTGQPITFNDNLQVWYGTRYLEEGKDYKVSYSNNKTPASKDAEKKAPTVTITGQGDYTDKITRTFTILKKAVNDQFGDARFDIPENEFYRTLILNNKSKNQTPKLTLSLMHWNGKKTKLTNKEYELLYYPYWFDELGAAVIGDPITSIPNNTARYLIAIKATDNSATLTGDPTKMEVEERLRYLDTMPRVDVYNTDEVTVADINKATLSPNLKTLNLQTDETGYYNPDDIYGLFYGENPDIAVKIGKRQLTAFDYSAAQPWENADFFVEVMGYPKAGENTLVLYGAENFEKPGGDPTVVGVKFVKFNITPKLKMSSSTVKVEGLKKEVILDNYDRFNIWDEGDDNPDKLAVDNDWSKVVLKDKAGNVIPWREPRVNQNNDDDDDDDDDDEWEYNYYWELSDYRRGTGTITVTFTGNPERGYTGSVSQKISVKQADMATLTTEGKLHIEFERSDPDNPEFEFTQAGVKPDFRVVYDTAEGWSMDLTEGTDFTVSWSDNKKVTGTGKKAKLTIKGKGYFKGSASKEFTIVEADFDHMYWNNQLSVGCDDVIYNEKGKAGYFKKVPVVYDGTKKLNSTKDYKVLETGEYYYQENYVDENGQVTHVQGERISDTDKVPVGAMIGIDQKIQVLNASYTDSRPEEEQWIHAEYRVVTKDMNISSATVVVNNNQPVSLGEDWNVMPPIKVTHKKLGELNKDDYVIESVENNWKVGTATMILRGKGRCCGTKKVTFKIVKTSINTD